MAKPVANLWISIVLAALIVLGTPGCATITVDLPDNHDVDEVPLALVPKFVGGALRVLPATGGEVLTYRFRYYRRGMDPAEWNPFLVAHLKRELARRGVDTDRGRTVTVRLIEFEAGTKALGGGKRAIFVVEVLGDGFKKRYTGSDSGYWSTLDGTMGRAVSEVLAEMLGDEAFQALMGN